MFPQSVNTKRQFYCLSKNVEHFSFILISFFSYFGSRSMAPNQVRNKMESHKFRRDLEKARFQEKPEQARFTKNQLFFSHLVYLDYSAAIPGKLLDQLAAWPPQRRPRCSQRNSNQKLQNGFDENNWPHLSLSPTQCLSYGLQHKHLR